jgi:hypothetical protein
VIEKMVFKLREMVDDESYVDIRERKSVRPRAGSRDAKPITDLKWIPSDSGPISELRRLQFEK